MKRRHFNSTLMKFVFLGGLVQIFTGVFTWAAEKCEHLIDMTKKKNKTAENDQAVAIATGLGFVPDVEKAAKTQKLERKPADATCGNCNHFLAETPKAQCAKCRIIPAGSIQVPAAGWCKLWMAKQKGA